MKNLSLREARLRRRLTLKEVAETLHINRATLSRVERGLEQPKPALARALHAFYQGQVDWPAILLAPVQREWDGRRDWVRKGLPSRSRRGRQVA